MKYYHWILIGLSLVVWGLVIYLQPHETIRLTSQAPQYLLGVIKP